MASTEPKPQRAPQWKEGKVLSLKLRDDSWALLQMLKRKGDLAVFSYRSLDNQWSIGQLEKENFLFSCFTTKAVLKRSELALQSGIKGIERIQLPSSKIQAGDGFKKRAYWIGTDDEIEFICFGQESNSIRTERVENGRLCYDYRTIKNEEFDTYRHLELTSLRDYPEFNERIFLSLEAGHNIDPLKELIFDRPAKEEFKTYYKIISGKHRLDYLGY